VLEQRRRRTTLRLLHLSPPDAIASRVMALEQGADDAVSATIDPAELLARLRLLDAQARRPRTALLEVADGVVLDLVAHEVRRDGVLVHLRPREFQLLAMLATHPGRAYTRRQLLDRVWGHDHDGDPRTVDVHVRWLRAKLERIPETPAHLVTVRGVGYRLDPSPR
jgi:DNA-binding response OmpR family regulator